jgi:hypothetical protein
MAARHHGAQFEPFVEGGKFANLFRAPRCRVRVLAPPRRKRSRIAAPLGAAHARAVNAIERAARVAAARRWLPLNPLLAHAMRAEDAIWSRR